MAGGVSSARFSFLSEECLCKVWGKSKGSPIGSKISTVPSWAPLGPRPNILADFCLGQSVFPTIGKMGRFVANKTPEISIFTFFVLFGGPF